MAGSVTPDEKQMKSFLIGLLNTPSPTGFTHRALDYIENALSPLPVTLHRTQKGSLVAGWAGRASTAPRARGHFVDINPATGLIDQDQIGKRAADIGRESDHRMPMNSSLVAETRRYRRTKSTLARNWIGR